VLVIPSGVYKWSIHPFTSPYPVYSHTPTRDNTFKNDKVKERVYVGNTDVILRILLKRIKTDSVWTEFNWLICGK
jgi:hypothetical protein